MLIERLIMNFSTYWVVIGDRASSLVAICAELNSCSTCLAPSRHAILVWSDQVRSDVSCLSLSPSLSSCLSLDRFNEQLSLWHFHFFFFFFSSLLLLLLPGCRLWFVASTKLRVSAGKRVAKKHPSFYTTEERARVQVQGTTKLEVWPSPNKDSKVNRTCCLCARRQTGERERERAPRRTLFVNCSSEVGLNRGLKPIPGL